MASQVPFNKMPAEVNEMIFEYALLYDGKDTSLLEALKSEPKLYEQACEVFCKENTVLLTKENGWRNLACSNGLAWRNRKTKIVFHLEEVSRYDNGGFFMLFPHANPHDINARVFPRLADCNIFSRPNLHEIHLDFANTGHNITFSGYFKQLLVGQFKYSGPGLAQEWPGLPKLRTIKVSLSMGTKEKPAWEDFRLAANVDYINLATGILAKTTTVGYEEGSTVTYVWEAPKGEVLKWGTVMPFNHDLWTAETALIGPDCYLHRLKYVAFTMSPQ